MRPCWRKLSHASTLFPESNYYSSIQWLQQTLHHLLIRGSCRRSLFRWWPDPNRGSGLITSNSHSSTFLEIIHQSSQWNEGAEIILCDLSSAGLRSEFGLQAQHCLGGNHGLHSILRADFEFFRNSHRVRPMHRATIEKLINRNKTKLARPWPQSNHFSGYESSKVWMLQGSCSGMYLFGIRKNGWLSDFMSVWGSNCWSNIMQVSAHIQFLFHDPWKWIFYLVQIQPWASSLHLVSFEEDFTWKWETTRLYDDIHSAQLWWDIQVCFCFLISASIDSLLRGSKMPEVDKLPHCFLCHLISGLIKAKSQPPLPMHLCLARAGFFHKEIREWLREWRRSTVGLQDKSVILIFLTFLFHMWFGITRLLIQVIPWLRQAADTVAFGLFKREVYHKVLRRFQFSRDPFPTRWSSEMWWWSTLWLLFPGIPIQSVDEKRLVLLVQLGGPQQIITCPHCLVHKHQLHEVINSSLFHCQTMRKCLQQSLAAPHQNAAEAILKDHGC